MANIFNIPQSAGELVAANQGTANAQYHQIPALRDITRNQFSNGIIHFRFETSGTTWQVPQKSFFRLRCTLGMVRTDTQGALPIKVGQDIAPAMGLAANLFKDVSIKLVGKSLDRISERLPQIDAIRTRMSKSKAFLDTVGRASNFWDYDWNVRQQQVAVDGWMADEQTWEPVYQPVPLTAEQAGFDPATDCKYTVGDDVIEFKTGANIDIVKGPMALRAGDKITSPTVAGDVDCIILKIISATKASVRPQGGDAGKKDWVGARTDFRVHKLAFASRNDVSGSNQFEIIWQPPLGFFDYEFAIPPGGFWSIEFNPESINDFKKHAVQSLTGELKVINNKLTDTKVGEFDFSVDEMYYYMYTVDHRRFDNGDYYLDIKNVRCQLESLPADATALTQKNYEINGKSTALAIAFQDQLQGTSTLRNLSILKIRPALGAQHGQELLLKRFFVNYANAQKPSPDFDGRYTEEESDGTLHSTDQLKHRYNDTMMQTGCYHAEGGCESFTEWMQRGVYFYFNWPKDGFEDNTRVNVNVAFRTAFKDTPLATGLPGGTVMAPMLLLFNWWRTAYHVKVKGGRIESMTVEEL